MFKEDYDEYIKGFDVLEKDSKFYLRFKPDVLYDTRGEAEKISDEYKGIMIFF